MLGKRLCFSKNFIIVFPKDRKNPKNGLFAQKVIIFDAFRFSADPKRGNAWKPVSRMRRKISVSPASVKFGIEKRVLFPSLIIPLRISFLQWNRRQPSCAKK